MRSCSGWPATEPPSPWRSAAEIDFYDSLDGASEVEHFLGRDIDEAVACLGLRPGQIVVDGNKAPEFPGFDGPVRALVGADRSCQAVGAASILAKVARDREMLLLHGQFPQYGFDRHKGYPTAAHREVLMRLGPCAVHRRSFRPVSEAIGRSAPP